MEDAVFVAVVAGRFLLPLLIPFCPLPAIVACLVLDAADQTIFQAFGFDPPGYQNYDKAMDIFYLSIAYLAAMRNWDNLAAFAVARFLFYYRLAGAFLFEVTHERWVLLVFPNTFEYFFIAYELWRTRWRTRPVAERTWILTAAFIWIFVKLPQEYWLHVAELDVTDTLHDYWWAWPLLIFLLVLLAVILWFGVRPRLPESDHALRLVADPVPDAVDTGAKLAAIHLAGGWVLSWMTLEKVVLVGLVSVIYGQFLPGVTSSTPDLFVSIGVLVALNAGITLLFSRQRWTIESAGLAVIVRIGLNVLLVAFVDQLGPNADGWDTFFFLCLISLITTLHDRYQPVYAYRRSRELDLRAA
ncbi:hypothetical protein [Nocardioides sp. YIM 152315]|uniref:hypothetical protein n=1 Tax=Nocardioides sp. YIM 152315 TaxID=3031760 RepID=UPI0023DBE7AE|nr:hypothetical protein [Nocardioides sp. YIM 152315]MDF1603354.1 hypothetical protein [Nocardioides sp. YIM 152315]